ncbi:hypothetical protein [Nitrosospira briensis]|uniref:hypothetical protein n=1 Tax=Nitrosospira briensis TaxID=35799 RepID=UPI0011602008|nr:hypothetical protein [Nitrosospira briensis]
MKGLKVMRSVNITGLGPHEVVGSISLDPDPAIFGLDRNFLETQDFPDSLSLRLSPGCSYLMETTFVRNAHPDSSKDNRSVGSTPGSGVYDGVTASDVTTVRDGIQELIELISSKISLEVKQIMLANVAQLLEDTTKDHTKLLEDLNKQYPGNNLSDKSAVDKELQSMSEQLKAFQESVKKKRETLKQSLQKPGIIVTRWAKEEKKKGGIDALKAITSRASESKQQEGFLVLGNPRVTSLLVGDDFPDQVGMDHREVTKKIRVLFKSDRTYVTYYQLAAQHVAWGEVRSGVSNKAIQADVSKVISTLHPYLKGVNAANFASLINDLQFKAELEISKAYDYGNSGFMSGRNTRIFHTHYGDKEALIAEQKRAQGYQPIYSARGTLEKVLAAFNVERRNQLGEQDKTKCSIDHKEKESFEKDLFGSDRTP